jgi:hypothetical protein
MRKVDHCVARRGDLSSSRRKTARTEGQCNDRRGASLVYRAPAVVFDAYMWYLFLLPQTVVNSYCKPWETCEVWNSKFLVEGKAR